MLAKIDKLILKSFFGPFITTFSVVVFIFLMRFILFYFEDIIGKDIEYLVMAELVSYFCVITFTIALPLSMLVSSLMAFGQLGEFFELIALKSSGISSGRIFRSIFVVAIIISFATYWIANSIVPWASLKGYSLLWDIKSTKTTLNIKEGIFYHDLPGYTLKVEKKFPDQKTLKNLIIYNHSENNANKRVTLADSAQMYIILNKSYLVFELFNGVDYMEDVDKSSVSYSYKRNDFTINEFKHSKMVISLKDFDIKRTDESQFTHHQMMKTAQELADTSAKMKNEVKLMGETMFNTAQQYYFYHLKKPNGAVKTIKKGEWLTKAINKNINKDYEKASLRGRALEQAKSVLNYAEGNIGSINAKTEQIAAYDLEWHKKITVGFSVLVMFLIGASIGAIVKRGGFGVPVIIAIIFFIISYLLTTNGDKLAKEGFVSPIFGAWLSNVILAFVGLYFYKKASEDSQLFEPDIYKMKWQKFIEFNKGILSKLKSNKIIPTELNNS